MPPHPVLARLRELVEGDPRTATEIAAAARMNRSFLSQLMTVDRLTPTVETVGRILFALGRKWADLDNPTGEADPAMYAGPDTRTESSPIRRAREARGLTREEVARRLGVNASAIYQAEARMDARRRPETLRRYAEAIGCPVAEIATEIRD